MPSTITQEWIQDLYQLSQTYSILTNQELTNFAMTHMISLEYIESLYDLIRTKLDVAKYQDDESFIPAYLLTEMYLLHGQNEERLDDILSLVSKELNLTLAAVTYHYETVYLHVVA